MATRGLRSIRGYQVAPTELRDSHFDTAHPINENKVSIDWANHKEMLQATKIDVTVQKNDVVAAGQTTIDITDDMTGRVVSTGDDVEGVVLSEKVILRQAGTQDSPIPDADADPAYGRIRYVEADSTWHLDFFSIESDQETAFTIPAGMEVDYLFVLRTNMANLPVDALLRGGSVFVEGATDAKAYFNILQLVKDVYGASGTADNDGNGNLVDEGYGKSLYERVKNYIAAVQSTAAAKGATLMGVTVNADYSGTTVQAVLNDIADRVVAIEGELIDARSRAANTANGVFTAKSFADVRERFGNIETTVDTEVKSLRDRVTSIEGATEELVVEADGTGTQVTFALTPPAVAKSVRVAVNGILQAPILNYDRTVNGSGHVTSITLPEALTIGPAPESIPDALYITWDEA